MPLTPADVHNVAFKKPPVHKRGYDDEEVDAFLDLVEAELARLIEENTDLRNQVAELEAKLQCRRIRRSRPKSAAGEGPATGDPRRPPANTRRCTTTTTSRQRDALVGHRPVRRLAQNAPEATGRPRSPPCRRASDRRARAGRPASRQSAADRRPRHWLGTAHDAPPPRSPITRRPRASSPSPPRPPTGTSARLGSRPTSIVAEATSHAGRTPPQGARRSTTARCRRPRPSQSGHSTRRSTSAAALMNESRTKAAETERVGERARRRTLPGRRGQAGADSACPGRAQERAGAPHRDTAQLRTQYRTRMTGYFRAS